jgi:hypothetical protein
MSTDNVIPFREAPPPAAAPQVESQKALEQAGQAFMSEVTRGLVSAWRMGHALNTLSASREANGLDSRGTRGWVHRNVRGLSPATLSTYAAVARRFSEALCLRYGLRALGHLLTYARLAGLPPLPEDPGQVPVQIPTRRGDGLYEKPFARCSVDELRRAVKRQRTPWLFHPVPPSDTHLAARLQGTLQRRLGWGTDVSARAWGTRTVFNFDGVPREQLRLFAQVLQEVLGDEPSMAVVPGGASDTPTGTGP